MFEPGFIVAVAQDGSELAAEEDALEAAGNVIATHSRTSSRPEVGTVADRLAQFEGGTRQRSFAAVDSPATTSVDVAPHLEPALKKACVDIRCPICHCLYAGTSPNMMGGDWYYHHDTEPVMKYVSLRL